MNRTRKILLVTIAVLGLAVGIRFAWSGRTIGVFYRARSWGGSQPILEFQLNQPYELTAVKIVKAASPADPVWQLKPDGGDRKAVRRFLYGRKLDGMRSMPDRPEPLERGTGYQLIVESGRHRGEVKFVAP